MFIKQRQAMQVYSVIGGWHYEGENGPSLQLFDCKSAAEAYAEELKNGDYDYALINVLEVQMHSALAV
jgi:hypothetical protein